MTRGVGLFQNFGPSFDSLPTTDNYNGRTCLINGVPFIYVAGAWKEATPVAGSGGASGGPRIIQGTVSEAGSVIAGSGFTVTREATGKYTITFTVPFANPIVANATVYDNLSGTERNIFIPESTNWTNNGTTLKVWCVNSGSAAYTNTAFSFTVIDPLYVADSKSYIAAGTPWTTMNFGGAWGMSHYGGIYNTPQYRRDETGRVHLRGLVKSDNAYGAGDKHFYTLPVGFRPSIGSAIFDVIRDDGQGRLDISVSGAMSMMSAVSAGGYFSLDGISFQAEGQGITSMPITGMVWQTLNANTGFSYLGAPYNTLGYYKDLNGRVHLRGLLSTASSQAAGSVIATLPAGYRPLNSEVQTMRMSTGPGRIDVTTTGAITIQTLTAAGGWISLDGISFMEAGGPYTLGSTASNSSRFWTPQYPFWDGGPEVSIPNGNGSPPPTPLRHTGGSGNAGYIQVPAAVEQRTVEITLRALVRADSANWSEIVLIARCVWQGGGPVDLVAYTKSNTGASWNGASADWRSVSITDLFTIPAGSFLSVSPFVQCLTPYGGVYSRAFGHSAFHIKRID